MLHNIKFERHNDIIAVIFKEHKFTHKRNGQSMTESIELLPKLHIL